MTTMLVWYFLVIGPSLHNPIQVNDLFPDRAACEQFRQNVQQYIDAGLGFGATTTRCKMRRIIVEGLRP